MKETILVISAYILLAACSATQVMPEAQSVELVSEKPDPDKCKYVGEVIGSQGNWVTGDFTSNENLVRGARNELKNQAYQLNANIVYMQDMSNTNAWGSLGTTNTTAVGNAYRCE